MPSLFFASCRASAKSSSYVVGGLEGVEAGLLEQGLVVEERAGVEVPGEGVRAGHARYLVAGPGAVQVLLLVLPGGLVEVEGEARLGERGDEVRRDVDDVGQGAAGRVRADLVGVALGGLVDPLHMGAGVLLLEVGDHALKVRLEVGPQVPGLEGDVAFDLAGGVRRTTAVTPGAAGTQRQEDGDGGSGGESSAGDAHGWGSSCSRGNGAGADLAANSPGKSMDLAQLNSLVPQHGWSQTFPQPLAIDH